MKNSKTKNFLKNLGEFIVAGAVLLIVFGESYDLKFNILRIAVMTALAVWSWVAEERGREKARIKNNRRMRRVRNAI